MILFEKDGLLLTEGEAKQILRRSSNEIERIMSKRYGIPTYLNSVESQKEKQEEDKVV